jgi:hypothetical protein
LARAKRRLAAMADSGRQASQAKQRRGLNWLS